MHPKNKSLLTRTINKRLSTEIWWVHCGISLYERPLLLLNIIDTWHSMDNL